MVLHSHFLMVRFGARVSASDATEDAAVLTAVKTAARRWRGGPKAGPSLTAAARDGTGCAQVGMEGWRRSNKRMERQSL